MSINWGDHWGDATHHTIVHEAADGSWVGDGHSEGVDD
jgi:hypothetical protein